MNADEAYEKLKDQEWFRGLSLDRQGEICVLLAKKDTRARTRASEETFTNDHIISAIKSFLQYGENQFGKSQQGYFSGSGFGARALRFHLKKLEKRA